eukprot:scaffold23808_cov242-Skeletonema_menzelii.AAC.2
MRSNYYSEDGSALLARHVAKKGLTEASLTSHMLECSDVQFSRVCFRVPTNLFRNSLRRASGNLLADGAARMDTE